MSTSLTRSSISSMLWRPSPSEYIKAIAAAASWQRVLAAVLPCWTRLARRFAWESTGSRLSSLYGFIDAGLLAWQAKGPN